MREQTNDAYEKIRLQFESSPYPRKPLDASPKDDYNALFIHNLVTPYYLRYQKVVNTEGRLVLDAGCGSGWKSLMLAEANPGARIVGIDISEESIKLARQRLQYHGFENVEFHAIGIEKLPSLGLEFDYINCDEVLYILPNRDPSIGLKAMAAVLKPEGIIRTNLHSSLQRSVYHRAQEVFKMMGLMDDNPGELEVEVVIETVRALKDFVNLRQRGWTVDNERGDHESILMNHLLQGDKGYTIPEMFNAIRLADLEFVSMVMWQQWELAELFRNPDDLPAVWALSLPEASVEEKLRLFELLHPVHRLLDFWCANPNHSAISVPIEEWQASDWQSATLHLHPQLRTPQARADLVECIQNYRPFEISRYLTLTTTSPVWVDSGMAASLLPLWEAPQPFTSLVERWLKIRPCDGVKLEPVSAEAAGEQLSQLLKTLVSCLYVLVERP